MHVLHRLLASAIAILGCEVCGFAQNSTARAIDEYLRPCVQSGNFSGNVLVQRGGRILLVKSYGFADRERKVPNTAKTRFRLASLSMQFTAAAVLRLAARGSIRLDEHVSDIVEGINGADKITIRDLLIERSGLADINAFPNYDHDILQHHQTPATLVDAIRAKPLLFEPGSKFLHEEHSAYNLLALIIEKKTGMGFRAAMRRLVFVPLNLPDSGVDDDSMTNVPSMAKGYEPDGTYGVSRAKTIHWSAKAGNGSAYSTVGDEARWVDAFFGGRVASAALRDAVLDTSMRVGYGWFKGENQRFGQTAYYMNGRSPGFASFLLYLPKPHLAVVVLSNIYSSATTTIGYDIAALALELPYKPFKFRARALSPEELKSSTGTFQFGSDFYQPNAKLSLVVNDRELSLEWPSGNRSFLLPLDHDRFIDRNYWQEVRIQRDHLGKPTALTYDRFRGTR
jgi:CubicO group peptidase (beta-lactamase class C family)